MIDYDKLKVANELAKKYYDHSGSSVVIETNASYGCYSDKFILHLHLDMFPFRYDNIDDLIEKLTELTKPEPKYKAGDIVWAICEQLPECFTVLESNYRSNNKFMYVLNDNYPFNSVFEENLYPTKTALIQSKIAYWTAMREPVECQHESDRSVLLSCPGQYKCTKCGEFYR